MAGPWLGQKRPELGIDLKLKIRLRRSRRSGETSRGEKIQELMRGHGGRKGRDSGGRERRNFPAIVRFARVITTSAGCSLQAKIETEVTTQVTVQDGAKQSTAGRESSRGLNQ